MRGRANLAADHELTQITRTASIYLLSGTTVGHSCDSASETIGKRRILFWNNYRQCVSINAAPSAILPLKAHKSQIS